MKKILIAALFTCALVSATFADTLSDFNDSIDTFLGEINTALPDSAVIGGTWSDAYIGQLIGVPPHFGVGVAAGVTRFPTQGLIDAMDAVDVDLPVDTLVLPNFAIEGRVGGFILPFDAGIRFGMMPSTNLGGFDIGYLHYGVDARYAVIKGGLVLPKVSVGVGYYHTSGSITMPLEATALLGTLAAYAPGDTYDLDLNFATDVVEAKAQVSKSFVIVTPYAGVGVSMANSTASYDLGGLMDDSRSETVYGARAFGGLSLNLLLLKIDATGSYNFLSGNWGANVGTRIQL